MPSRPRAVPPVSSVAALEREIGIPTATLRMWERRYGFPQPSRDARGRRIYHQDQLEKLRLISQLINRGQRPGRLLGQSILELQAEVTNTSSALADAPLIQLLRTLDPQALFSHLLQLLASRGLREFVCRSLPEANAVVGQAWAGGALQPFEEHLYTECVQQVLRTALAGIPAAGGDERPRLLLTTLPGEQHALGLLMVQALAADLRCPTLALGLGLPPQQVAAAARAWRADCVALSVSECADARHVAVDLAQLRSHLPASTSLWLGGGSRALHRDDVQQLPGVRVFSAVSELPTAIEDFRKAARRSPAG